MVKIIKYQAKYIYKNVILHFYRTAPVENRDLPYDCRTETSIVTAMQTMDKACVKSCLTCYTAVSSLPLEVPTCEKVVYAVALEHNKHFPTSIVELMFSCFNLQFNTEILSLKKLENFVVEPVLNSESTWEVKNHALETLVKYLAIPKQFTPTSCF